MQYVIDLVVKKDGKTVVTRKFTVPVESVQDKRQAEEACAILSTVNESLVREALTGDRKSMWGVASQLMRISMYMAKSQVKDMLPKAWLEMLKDFSSGGK